MAKPATTKAPKHDIITEDELQAILSKEEELKTESAKLKKLGEEIGTMRAGITSRLKAGAKVTGRFTAVIDTPMGKCTPPWKDEYISHMEMEHGLTKEAAENEVREKYPAQPGGEKLVIGFGGGQAQTAKK